MTYEEAREKLVTRFRFTAMEIQIIQIYDDPEKALQALHELGAIYRTLASVKACKFRLNAGESMNPITGDKQREHIKRCAAKYVKKIEELMAKEAEVPLFPETNVVTLPGMASLPDPEPLPLAHELLAPSPVTTPVGIRREIENISKITDRVGYRVTLVVASDDIQSVLGVVSDFVNTKTREA